MEKKYIASRVEVQSLHLTILFVLITLLDEFVYKFRNDLDDLDRHGVHRGSIGCCCGCKTCYTLITLITLKTLSSAATLHALLLLLRHVHEHQRRVCSS